MLPHFELFDHTADMGVQVIAPTMAGLMAPATQGLYSIIGELVATSKQEAFQFELSGNDPAILLRDYLNQVLFVFERDHRMLISFEQTEFSREHLIVNATAAALDPEKCVYSHEVKAITYHELSIREIEGGFEARFIVDI
ncbi:MAG: archease [Planctomycetes bacterium]|nr:archease [Planctomycetota bacterium]MBI3832941.1 archease [Planctomycetota bacterium]